MEAQLGIIILLKHCDQMVAVTEDVSIVVAHAADKLPIVDLADTAETPKV